MIIEVGSLLYELEFGCIAVCHSAVQLSLQQKGDEEPVYADEAVVGAFIEEQNNSHNDGEGSLEYDEHVSKKSENELQIHIL